jgi:signal transduction histidine kinase
MAPTPRHTSPSNTPEETSTRVGDTGALVEAALRVREAFLSKLSHDLRNPLGAIAAATEVLARIGTQQPDAVRAREVIKRQVQQLTRVVDELLDATRLLAGKAPVSRTPLDLSAVVQRTIDAMQSEGRLNGHRLDLRLTPAWIEADSERIAQATRHLLANAIKFSPPDSVVTVHVVPEGEAVVLGVSDAGIGIGPAYLPRIFDPFALDERDTARRRAGFGLGLTLVKHIAEAHGGSIVATSAGEDRGSTFTLRLPRVERPRG